MKGSAKGRDGLQLMVELALQAGRGPITTTLGPASAAGTWGYAEDYLQQYLHKNPGGYCNHGPNGMTCPVGVVGSA